MFGMRRWLPLLGCRRGRARCVHRVHRPPRRRLGASRSARTRPGSSVGARRLVRDAAAHRRRLRRSARSRPEAVVATSTSGVFDADDAARGVRRRLRATAASTRPPPTTRRAEIGREPARRLRAGTRPVTDAEAAAASGPADGTTCRSTSASCSGARRVSRSGVVRRSRWRPITGPTAARARRERRGRAGRRWSSADPTWTRATGRALYVEAVPAARRGRSRSRPIRWTGAGSGARSTNHGEDVLPSHLV